MKDQIQARIERALAKGDNPNPEKNRLSLEAAEAARRLWKSEVHITGWRGWKPNIGWWKWEPNKGEDESNFGANLSEKEIRRRQEFARKWENTDALVPESSEKWEDTDSLPLKSSKTKDAASPKSKSKPEKAFTGSRRSTSKAPWAPNFV